MVEVVVAARWQGRAALIVGSSRRVVQLEFTQHDPPKMKYKKNVSKRLYSEK